MKRTHIIAIAVIAIAIGLIMSTSGDASVYVNFKEATERAEDGDKDLVHVVGTLKKDAEKHIIGMHYDPVKDPNYFTFQLMDQKGEEHSVVYFNPKPQDFDRSEQIVVTGYMEKDVFVANKILLKCPSKYVEKEVTAES
jgi:cytochrome c-type biogenesis protein CcmE